MVNPLRLNTIFSQEEKKKTKTKQNLLPHPTLNYTTTLFLTTPKRHYIFSNRIYFCYKPDLIVNMLTCWKWFQTKQVDPYKR